MIDWIVQALDGFTTRFLGISFSFGNFIALGIFFLSGYYFGKLTKKLNVLKIILIIVIGSYFYAFLHNAHFVIIWAFLLGILANHGQLIYRAYYWAYDLKDVVFALKHRRAFDDIRQREEELEERIRQFRKEKAEFQNQKSRENVKQKSSDRQQKTKQSSGAKKPKPTSYQDNLRAKHLRTLGLDPTQSFNPNQIRKAYRTMAKKTHPDTGGSQSAFIDVTNAYEWLRKG